MTAPTPTCLEEEERQAGEDPGAYGLRLVRCVGTLFSEAKCQQAWRDGGTDLSEFSFEAIATACRAAYCPNLAEPRPRLCHARTSTARIDPVDWVEFHTRALGGDVDLAHPPERQGKVAAAMGVLMAAIGHPSVGMKSSDAKTEPDSVVIAIDAKGRLFHDDKPVQNGDLDSRLLELRKQNPQAGLVIAADEKAGYKQVIRVLDAARKAGFRRLGIAARKQN